MGDLCLQELQTDSSKKKRPLTRAKKVCIKVFSKKIKKDH